MLTSSYAFCTKFKFKPHIQIQTIDRWRQCHYHCRSIVRIECYYKYKHFWTFFKLAARLLLFLTSFKEFCTRLSERSQLRTLVQLYEKQCTYLNYDKHFRLEPQHDPVGFYFNVSMQDSNVTFI